MFSWHMLSSVLSWLQEIQEGNHLASVEEESGLHIFFPLFPEVVKINITCPGGLKSWLRNMTHCLSLGYRGTRERVGVRDDSNQNSSW